ncbi:hypothetical protein HYV73_04315 [Candidatus Uhrbacteria bacterium]|nr:hypothetical protein [Candidatus Uhrbacteria bacterium]
MGKIIENKPILFVDFNGVLSYRNFWFSLEEVSHPLSSLLAPIQELVFSKKKELCSDWMRGMYTSEQIHERIGIELGIDVTALWEQFVIDCRNLDVSLLLLDKIRQLNEKYVCILRTDNMDTLERFTIPAHPEMRDAFHEIHNSYALGQLKGDDGGRYFLDMVRRYQTNLTFCVLVDDSETVCSLFRSLGGKSYCVTGEDQVFIVFDQLHGKIL